MSWLNRSLQKVILEMMANEPEIKKDSQEITLDLFNQDGNKYELKDMYYEIAQQLNLDIRATITYSNSFDSNQFAYSVPSGNNYFTVCKTLLGEWSEIIRKNMLYLSGHNLLIESDAYHYKITSKGIDFIQNDGGLSAILGVQTIKFHSDTIDEMRSLLEMIVQNSNLPEQEKSKLHEIISELGGEALKICLAKLLENAMDDTSSVIAIISTAAMMMKIVGN